MAESLKRTVATIRTAIHDTDGHNPHAHSLLTVRPLNPDGTWQHKTQKEYLCARGKEERGFTAEEYKTAQAEGWEKQYQYRVGRKKVYLPPSRAGDYERLSKTPRSTRFGRQNPISARWNSDEQLVLWRDSWADTVNCHLERMGETAQIDHRSHAARGPPELPTVHESVTARTMERKGNTADRCELNRQIKADNAFLRELRRQMERITKAVLDTISAIARALEALRLKLLMLQYQVLHYRSAAWQVADDLRDIKPDLTRFDTLTAEIKAKTAQQRSLTNEARTALQVRFGADYSEKCLSFAVQQVREMLPEEERELRQYWKEKWQIERENRKSQDRNRSKDTGR